MEKPMGRPGKKWKNPEPIRCVGCGVLLTNQNDYEIHAKFCPAYQRAKVAPPKTAYQRGPQFRIKVEA